MTDPPPFSVVVPTRNRPAHLAECLRALARLAYPPSRLEVVVVDDGSFSARAVAERELLDHIQIVEQSPSGPAAARNRGAAAASGTDVAFLDDDCAPVAAWLAELGRALTNEPTSIVGGPTVNALTSNPFATASQLVVDYLIGTDRTRSTGEVAFLPTSNLALSRELFLELGGFDGTFTSAGGEDRDFCARARARGHRLRLIEGARVHHRHELGAMTFWRQHYRYGRGAYRFRRARASVYGRLAPEPLSFYGGLVNVPKNEGMRGRRRFVLSTLLALSQVATAAGIAAEAVASGRSRPLETTLPSD